MSVFGNIMSKIFGGAAHAQTPAAAGTAATAPAPSAAAAAPTAGSAAAAPSGAPVDIAAILNDHVAKSGQQLDWRHSIVDLMKALGLDSSLSARKELAQELHYSGDVNDSAGMNIWLHKQVMIKLAQNGGKVPDDLKG
ncbi:DUF3597 domain-containing protein [Alsobacter sp. SYSU BS001988]|jgi:zona occludens toxin (predicted ATPase)